MIPMTTENRADARCTRKALVCTRHGWAAGWEEHRSIQGIVWTLPDGRAPKALMTKRAHPFGTVALVRVMPGMFYIKLDLLGGFEAYRVRDIRGGQRNRYAELEPLERAEVPEAAKLAALQKAEDADFLFARRMK